MLPKELILDNESSRSGSHIHIHAFLALQEPLSSGGNYPFLVWCAKFGHDLPQSMSSTVKYEVKACHGATTSEPA